MRPAEKGLCRILSEDGRHRFRSGIARECSPPGEHLEEHRAEAEEVAPRIHGLAPDLLGAHVAQGAQGHPFFGLVAWGAGGGGTDRIEGGIHARKALGQAEIEDLEASFLGDPEVAGLQISMHDPLLVSSREPPCHLDGQFSGSARGEGSFLKAGAKGLTFEQLHHHVGRILVIGKIVDGEDVRMAERGQGLRLPLEASQGVRALRQVLRQHLHGDEAIQARVLRLPDFAHAARAKGCQDFVRPESSSCLEGRGDRLPWTAGL